MFSSRSAVLSLARRYINTQEEDYSGVYLESIINLGGLVSPGDNFQIRFREANDNGNPESFAGWQLDDVKVCRTLRAYLPLIVR